MTSQIKTASIMPTLNATEPKELIAQGKIAEAMQMDYDDIERRNPGKYTAKIADHKAMYGAGDWLDPGC